MHLRSVTLRGFKSFASRTHLELDPGLIAVVGPNGAGKSNLIDALIWSLGTLSTRALRLDRMEDVIFQGTVNRPALGMAQVILTFDNSSKTFPVDFSEVQIGRTLFRDGASEYSLNGATCRLLDVSDLLSEAGIGRELHAVVAQGQVDDIVQSRPEELRAYVEEAAGISKYRRRKERAIRKIEHVDADISRAADVASELRRQLKPLRAQAEQALRHREVTERLRELRIRLAVAELESVERDRRRAVELRDNGAEQLAAHRARLESLRAEREAAEQRLQDARRTVSEVRRGLERLRSGQASTLRAVVVLRERMHARPDARRRDALVAKSASLQAEEGEVRTALDELSSRIAAREARLSELRDARRAAQEAVAAAGEELAQLREELRAVDVEMRGAEQQAIGARAEARAAGDRLERAAERIGRLQQQAAGIRQEIERLDAEGGRSSLTVERMEGERRAAKEAFEEADAKLRALESEAAVLSGRLESLRVARDLTASRRKGAETLRSADGVEIGARGVLGDIIRVASGLEAAVEAALGTAVDALVVGGSHVADAVARAEAKGTDVVLAATLPPRPPSPAIPGVRALSEVVECPGWLRGTVDALLSDHYLVDDWGTAAALAGDHPAATFVTTAGRVLAPERISRPARGAGKASLGITAALEKAEEAMKRVDAERSRWTTNRDRHRRDLDRLDGELDEARSALHEVEGRIAAAADRLRELGAEEKASSLERDLASGDRSDRLRRAETAEHRRTELADREQALRRRESELTGALGEAEGRLRGAEAEVRRVEEGLTELLTERASLTERLRNVERSWEEVRAEEAEAEAEPADPADVLAAEAIQSRLDTLVTGAEQRVRELMADEERVSESLREVSGETSRLEVQVASLEPRSLQAAEEVARCDVRIEEIGTRLAREFEIPPSRAREEFPAPGDVEAASTEERRLEAELRRMGPVNPLAAEEIVELDQRETFITGQLEDLRSSKRDLLRLVRATEERMREVLVRAVEDADVRFREVIALLFPEGDGRLRLVGHEDPLEAGLEIEVRLGRKGHRRLSFLSGGEKALAGLGFLFALHLARPTPFLVLDEVDAPLDDANLGRFIRLLDALRARTQVIVVTHQKRTMERADTLVGVTLNPDGTSRVVTQDVHEHAATAAERA